MHLDVAPYTGAWIETAAKNASRLSQKQSHPTRVRGLKPVFLVVPGIDFNVAPYTGAWIETPGS